MLNDLPGSVREIAEVIGRHEALFLIGQLPSCYAGNEGKKSNRVILYVPKRVGPDHRLVRILGWDVAQKLVRGFGGEILQPANCRAYYVRFRDRTIMDMLGEGCRPAMVAEIMGLSERYVRSLQRENPQEEIPQLDRQSFA